MHAEGKLARVKKIRTHVAVLYRATIGRYVDGGARANNRGMVVAAGGNHAHVSDSDRVRWKDNVQVRSVCFCLTLPSRRRFGCIGCKVDVWAIA
jgi:hypothetical protein